MRSASYQPSPQWDRGSPRRRAAGFLFALIAHLLLLLLLFALAPQQTARLEQQPSTFRLLPLSGGRDRPTPTKRGEKHAAAGHAPRRPAAAPPTHPLTAKPAPVPPLHMIQISHDAFAAGDIAALPSHPADRQTADSGAGEQGEHGAGDSAGAPGEGPGGATLYDADWQSRPTPAELSTYLPAAAPPESWGEIVCKTAARFHVEDCQALAESPAGSRMAQGVLQAAWQFRVLPPRLGGRPLLGAWVRIRITLSGHAPD